MVHSFPRQVLENLGPNITVITWILWLVNSLCPRFRPHLGTQAVYSHIHGGTGDMYIDGLYQIKETKLMHIRITSRSKQF